jgi:hypothetical protein
MHPRTYSSVASSGTGSAVSFNSAKASAQASGFGTSTGTTGSWGPVASGQSSVGGSASTTGTVTSLAATSGGGVAGGYGTTNANAHSDVGSNYLGHAPGKLVSGGAGGYANSSTNNVAGTASIGNGIAVVNSTAHTNSYFGANSQAISGPGGTSTSNNSGASSVGNATTTGFSLGTAFGGSMVAELRAMLMDGRTQLPTR